MTKTITDGVVFFFFFLEFGFVGKQKGHEKQQKGKAYNLMQCDQKTRTSGFFFFFLEFDFVEKQKLILLETNGKGKRL